MLKIIFGAANLILGEAICSKNIYLSLAKYSLCNIFQVIVFGCAGLPEFCGKNFVGYGSY